MTDVKKALELLTKKTEKAIAPQVEKVKSILKTTEAAQEAAKTPPAGKA